jgi:hypothetical protein
MTDFDKWASWMNQWTERLHRKEAEYLEGQAKLFIAMGFAPQELMIVQDMDGGDPQVVPHME